MSSVYNYNIICGILFILIVVILVVAIVRKGKLWGKENEYYYNTTLNIRPPSPNCNIYSQCRI